MKKLLFLSVIGLALLAGCGCKKPCKQTCKAECAQTTETCAVNRNSAKEVGWTADDYK